MAKSPYLIALLLIGWLSAGELLAAEDALLIKAERLFDGHQLKTAQAVLIVNQTIQAVGDFDQLRPQATRILDLGDATLLPGLIELHSHIVFQQIPVNTVLEHGVTTARDLGGALLPAESGAGKLRLLSAGPILTVADGYPLTVFAAHPGHHQHYRQQSHDADEGQIAIAIETVEQARAVVRDLVAHQASVIKVALEPGGEAGAPWNQHGHAGPQQWPMLSAELLQAITDQAHQLGKRVSAHLSENRGVKLALAAGVDEWAHMPCLKIAPSLLQQAAQQGVTIISTLDTLSHCPGIADNTRQLAQLGATILYGAELAHADIPWGFDSHELQLIMHLTGIDPLDALQTATEKAGQYLGLAPLGQLRPQAPADLLAVKGNLLMRLKSLEYPDLVMTGGQLVVNRFVEPKPVPAD